MSIKIFPVISFVLLLVGCDEKHKDDAASNTQNEIVLIDDVPYELLETINCNSVSDSGLWDWANNGNVQVDHSSSVGDSTVFVMDATDDCFLVEKKKGVAMVLQQESAIQLSYQLPKTTFEDYRHGRELVCSGACKMEIYQGDKVLFSTWISETSVWTDLQFYFRTKLTEEVKIRFILGTQKGFWVDNIKILQKL
jgi:hypothetical protein